LRSDARVGVFCIGWIVTQQDFAENSAPFRSWLACAPWHPSPVPACGARAIIRGGKQGSLPRPIFDFTALTHIIHFSLVPNANGTLNSSDNGISSGNSADIVSRAHAAGLKVLICVGGAGSESLLKEPRLTNLPAFITILQYSWRPAATMESILIGSHFTSLTPSSTATWWLGCGSALNGFPEHKLLTVAAGAYSSSPDPSTVGISHVRFAAKASSTR